MRETAREEPNVPFNSKDVVEDFEPPNITSAGTSLRIREVGGPSSASLGQEAWNPPSLTPTGEHVQVYL